ncbi:MAG: ABC transporter ATP-binding protein [Anaerolineae bacterium]|nr:ABC transporter ATP-binding protein [Anaerolineae bacterium]
MRNHPVVQVRDLAKRYGDVRAVDGVSFDVGVGEVFGLLGPNGAGKTTTVECVLGLRQPDAGTIAVLGMAHSTHSRQIRARVGAQLQTTGLYPRLTVREQVALFARLYPDPMPVEQAIDMVGLGEVARTQTAALSGGQGQRLAVALALVGNPDLVFLDEPTTGLDPRARREVWEVVRGLRRDGKAVLFTTHYMEEAEQLCDRVAVIDRGQIIALDTPEALINEHFHETALEFVALGEPPREQLAALPGVTQALFENGRPTLYSSDVPRTMAGLFELVASGALAFKDMVVRQATLEDVFLKLTGRRIQHAVDARA